MHTRASTAADADWIASLIRERWHGPYVVTRGRRHDTRCLPGIVACDGDRPVGVLLYAEEGSQIEIVTLDALEPRKGVGRLLLEAITANASRRSVRRVWLITTNDNTDAIAFYTACGFRLVAVHLDAVTESRKIKPEMPNEGVGGIPIRDELEFEKICPASAPGSG